MNRRRTYSGLCIGGPMARMSLVNELPTFECHERTGRAMLSVEPIPGPAKFRITVERYNWIEIEGMGLWILDGTTASEAMGELALHYSGEIAK